MPGAETLIGFFFVAVLLALSPGPDNLFVTLISAAQGRRAGIMVSLGLCSGLVFHTLAVALGLAAIFAASPVAFQILKVVGTAYLLYLAWQAWRASRSMGASEARTENVSLARLYMRGIIMNLTNPKVILFFLAFLPQFVRIGAGPVMFQLLLLGLVFIIAALVVFISIACMSDFLGERLRKSASFNLNFNRVAAIIFVGLAVKLLISQQ